MNKERDIPMKMDRVFFIKIGRHQVRSPPNHQAKTFVAIAVVRFGGFQFCNLEIAIIGVDGRGMRIS